MSRDTWRPDLWTTAQETAAAEARSILACPATATLSVEGVEDPVADDDLSLLDDAGTPVLLALAGSTLDRAAELGATARLLVTGALPPQPGTSGELELVGRLTRHHCCDRGQVVLTLDVDHVLLHGGDGNQTRAVEPRLYSRPELRLNRGYLERSAQHANHSHQPELRQAVALATGTRPNAIAAVQLEEVTPAGVLLAWVDSRGAHRASIDFDRVARTPEELATLLSEHLHSDLC